MARGARSGARRAESEQADRTPPHAGGACLSTPFELSTILSSAYLVPVTDIREARVGTTPCREYGGQMAARLDSRRARLPAGSAERAVVDWVLGDAPSFRAKWASSYEAAVPDLTVLARRGVNPSIFSACLFHFGWQW